MEGQEHRTDRLPYPSEGTVAPHPSTPGRHERDLARIAANAAVHGLVELEDAHGQGLVAAIMGLPPGDSAPTAPAEQSPPTDSV